MILIGIDPGTHTGYAVWDTHKRSLLRVETMVISRALQAVSEHQFDVCRVIVEDARLRKWLGTKARESLQGAGSIKRDCSIWQEALEDMDMAHVFRGPAKGLTKLDAERFRRLTGWQGRTSSHARDAAMLIWNL